MILDHSEPSSSTDVKQSACWEAPQHCKYLYCIHFDLSVLLNCCFSKNSRFCRSRLARILAHLAVTFALSAVGVALSAVWENFKKNIFPKTGFLRPIGWP